MMTDDELAEIRRFIDSDERNEAKGYGYAENLLDEVARLRAELAGRRAGDDELAKVRGWVESYEQGARGSVSPHWMTLDIRQLLDHIDWQQEQIRILLTDEDGLALAREQGAAEERARLVAMIRRDAGNWEPNGSIGGELERLATYIERGRPLPDLLPPVEARAALDREREKVATLRAACERMIGLGLNAHVHECARKVLEETE